MKKYNVTFYYHTNCVVEVEAENENDARKKAEVDLFLKSSEYEKQLLSGLQEDDSPTIEEA